MKDFGDKEGSWGQRHGGERVLWFGDAGPSWKPVAVVCFVMMMIRLVVLVVKLMM